MLSGLSFAEEITREDAMGLMDERQINIAPYKEQPIETCVTDRRRDREYCGTHYKNFGEKTPVCFGGFRYASKPSQQSCISG